MLKGLVVFEAIDRTSVQKHVYIVQCFWIGFIRNIDASVVIQFFLNVMKGNVGLVFFPDSNERDGIRKGHAQYSHPNTYAWY